MILIIAQARMVALSLHVFAVIFVLSTYLKRRNRTNNDIEMIQPYNVDDQTIIAINSLQLPTPAYIKTIIYFQDSI